MYKKLLQILYVPFTFFFRAQCLLQRGKVRIGKNLQVCGFILLKNKGEIIIGDNVRLNSGRICNSAAGGVTSLQVLKGGKLHICDRVGISNTAITCSIAVIIEDDVNIGADCIIADTDFHSLDHNQRIKRRFTNGQEVINTRQVRIGKGSWIGMRTTILKGVEVGEMCIIGACSTVSSSLPPRKVAVGSPCRPIRSQ